MAILLTVKVLAPVEYVTTIKGASLDAAYLALGVYVETVGAELVTILATETIEQ